MPKRSDEKLFGILEISQCPRHVQGELRALVREGASLKPVITRFDEVKKRIAEIVLTETLMNEDGLYGVRDGPIAVIIRQQEGRESLNKELLIENGVTPAQIRASMKRGTGFNVTEFQVMEGAD